MLCVNTLVEDGEGGELFMPEDSAGTRTNVHKLAQNKFSLEIGRSFLTIREQSAYGPASPWD